MLRNPSLTQDTAKKGTRRNRKSRRQNVAPLQMESLETRACPASVVVAESTFDPDLFADAVGDELDFHRVGYSLAVSYQDTEGVTAITGGFYGRDEGIARFDVPEGTGEVEFETDTRTEIASVSKIITTVAVLRALDALDGDLAARLNDPITDYLPSDWIPGQNVDLITVRHLLTHTSGFFEGGDGDPANDIGVNFEEFDNNTFSNLRDLFETGVSAIPSVSIPNGSEGGAAAWPRSYSNANYAFLGRMLSYMVQDLSREELDDVATNDLMFGVLYRDYVRENVLEPAGIVDPGMSATGHARGYEFLGADSSAGVGQEHYTAFPGAFGWKLSAIDLVNFLRAVQHGDEILSEGARELMNRDDFVLGWKPDDAPPPALFSDLELRPPHDEFGNYYTHGGAANHSHDGVDGGFRSRIDAMPGGVEVALVSNDDGGLPSLSDFYRNSWTDLVIQADSGDNVFTLQLNAKDPTLIDLSIESDAEDDFFRSYRVDVLQSLELRGLGGSDTFVINDLPENIDLVLNGGQGHDTFDFGEVGSVFSGIEGNLAALGGSGNDDLNFNDIDSFNDDYTITGLYDGSLLGDTTIEASSYGTDKRFQYGDIENVTIYANDNDSPSIALNGIAGNTVLELYAGNDHNEITVRNVGDSARITVYGQGGSDSARVDGVAEMASVTFVGDDAGPGNDNLTIGSNLSNIQGTVHFDGRLGSDHLVVDDSASSLDRGLYFLEGSIFGSRGLGTVSHEGVEKIELQAGDGDDDVSVIRLASQTDLELFGNAGNDTFRIADLSHDLNDIEGNILVHGGDGKLPPSHNEGDVQPLHDDRLIVLDDANSLQVSDYSIDTIIADFRGRLSRCDIVCGTASNEPRPTIEFDQIEQTTLRADQGSNLIDVLAMPTANSLIVYAEAGDDTINVETSPLAATMQVFGGSDNDAISVTPSSGDLGYLRGPVFLDGGGDPSDQLHVSDIQSLNDKPYTLSDKQVFRANASPISYSELASLAISLSNQDNDIDVNSTAPGTSVLILGNEGNDTLAATNLESSLVFDGLAGTDHAQLIGTDNNDSLVVQGNLMTIGNGSLMTFVEERSFNGLDGDDLMTFQGVAAVDELFRVRPLSLCECRIRPYEGTVDVTGQVSLDFRRTEAIVVEGNPSDDDELRFNGYTSPFDNGEFDDWFNINLSAGGTAADPLMVLKDKRGKAFLTLQNYQNVGVPTVRSLYGADAFDVHVNPNPASMDRHLHLDGGLGPAKISIPIEDVLRVTYADHGDVSWEPENDNDGSIDLEYDPLVFDLVYEAMETVKLLPDAGL